MTVLSINLPDPLYEQQKAKVLPLDPTLHELFQPNN